MKDFELNLPAGDDMALGVSGSFVRLKASTGALVFKAPGSHVSLAAGDYVRMAPFRAGQLRVQNLSGSAVDCTVTIGDGDAGSTRDISLSVASTMTDAADVSIGAASTDLVLAANANRREAMISNLATNTQTMRIGTTNAGAARGVEIEPGQTIVLSTSAAIYAFNPGGGAETLGVLELEE